jgi:DNA (cytosine-5)-methyltransferase 1
MGVLGYGWAYRVLDAQYFGVPQRRRRVFVVGYLGDWRSAAAVLFERGGLAQTEPQKRTETGVFGFDNGLSKDFHMPHDDGIFPCLIKARGYAIATPEAIRYATPIEAERTQGFPDNYTLVPYRGKMSPDGLRHEALGNSMATNVMAWIFGRIAVQDAA